MKQKGIVSFLVLFFILGFFYWKKNHESNKYVVAIEETSLEVEIANTPYLRQKGLMGRDHLDEDKGMLFLFITSSIQTFWMKNTLIPLSIAFIRRDGTISEILDMEPDSFNGRFKEYVSKEAVPYVLEVNQGWFQSHGIKVNERVHFSSKIQRILVE